MRTWVLLAGLTLAGCWEGDGPTLDCGVSGEPCDDGNPCSVKDTCTEHGCLGEPSSFAMGCDDGNVCTLDDLCVGIACRGTLAPNGYPCDDGEICTVADACEWGECGGQPKDCSEVEDACQAGVCEAATGQCTAQPRRDGTPCDDGDACTLSDECQDGACGAGPAVDCSELDGECTVGTCRADDGQCEAAPVEDGLACDDGVACTMDGECATGVCQEGPPVDCTALSGGCLVGECNPETDECEGTAVDNGTWCNDGSDCTVDDVCTDGACAGESICPCYGVADGEPCDELLDTELRLLDADGRPLVSNDNVDEQTPLSLIRRYESAVSAPHFVEVTARNAPGRYRLLVPDLRCRGDADCGCPDQVCNGDEAAPGQCVPAALEDEESDTTPLAVGDRIVGHILESRDVDLFTVTLEPGRYDIETHDYCGAALDTYLEVYLPEAAAPTAENDDGGEGRLSLISGFEVVETVDYLVVVRAYGFGAGSYVLEVRAAPEE